jgi:hypothetical protein
MKVAVLSESSADEAAIRILLEAILGIRTEAVPSHPSLRVRGWPMVIRVLPAIIKWLHYQTDAEALVVIADSDDSPVHEGTHELAGGEDRRCRLCQLRNVTNTEKARLTHLQNRAPLKTAIGLAVPAIEAWYVCGLDPHVNEATWKRKLQSEKITFTRNLLKKQVYGTDRPTIGIETRQAVGAAARLAADLTLIEQLFPVGFGSFAQEVRNW